MRCLTLLAAMLLTALAGILPAGAVTRFLTGSEDVPLMEGLAEIPDTRIIFDTPGGRIVDVDTKGTVSADDVADFYRESLPALGWKPDQAAGGSAYTFRRASEILVITVHGENDGDDALGVRFNLRPHAL